ncbi:hypothetical protein P4O66_012322, partial [Electrophorus voltai]
MQIGTFDAKIISKLGTWNVRTLCEGGKLTQLLHEFDNYNLDILGVSEMHWTGSGKIVSDGKSVLYSGHEEHHIHGVGLVLSKKASCALLGWKPVNDRIITARFQSRHAKTSLIQVYAPTEDSDDDQKHTFYGLLQDTIDEIPTHDVKLLISDFNAQITDDRCGLENIIGPHSSGRQTNDNAMAFSTVGRQSLSRSGRWIRPLSRMILNSVTAQTEKTKTTTTSLCCGEARMTIRRCTALKEQDARWVEHFKETLNQPTPANTYDFGATPPPPDLVVNLDLITIEETKVPIRTLKANKAPGLDEIAPEMLKHSGDTIANTLTVLFNKCWQDQSVPSDWRKGVIVKLPKKANTADCNNWRGITLLSVPGKVFCSVLLRHLQQAVDKILQEELAGFRAGRSCSKQIYTLRNIIEQCIEFQQPLLINFIDFKKAFDSNLYISSSCCVRTDDGYTDFFNIETGVKQGCILSPILFLLTVDYVMKKVMMSSVTGIPWTNGSHLTDLDFADHIALLANTKPALQFMTTCLEGEVEKVGLCINTDKTKVMRVNLQDIDEFTYLGSIVSNNDGGSEADVR